MEIPHEQMLVLCNVSKEVSAHVELSLSVGAGEAGLDGDIEEGVVVNVDGLAMVHFHKLGKTPGNIIK